MYLNGSETHVGRNEIAPVITQATRAVDFRLQLLNTPMVIRGNYVAAAPHWANEDMDGLAIAVFRFDGDGLIDQKEVLVPQWE